jgi:hypothetical protein
MGSRAFPEIRPCFAAIPLICRLICLRTRTASGVGLVGFLAVSGIVHVDDNRRTQHDTTFALLVVQDRESLKGFLAATDGGYGNVRILATKLEFLLACSYHET